MQVVMMNNKMECENINVKRGEPVEINGSRGKQKRLEDTKVRGLDPFQGGKIRRC